ncbi:TNT domain-containing protein [Streptomyces violascens]|uniref:TNT domain-containing protein n=1 Tax=Streptomyces violascens TaxID=67381 RepID=UPI001CFDE47B|nr:TNT domain-containing protein [Streptomyces violascens]
MTTAMVMALGSGVATAAAGDERTPAAAPVGERPSATPPHVHGEPAPQAYRAPGAAAANQAPNTPQAPEVGPPFKQTSGVWVTDTVTPTLRNTVVDADKDKTTSTFEVWTADAAWKPVKKVNLTDANKYDVLVSGYVAAGQAASVKVDPGKLTNNTNYLVRSSAYDGSAYETDWSPWAKFKTSATPVDPPVTPGDPNGDIPADVKSKWQELAKKSLAAYDAEQKKIADTRAHGLDGGEVAGNDGGAAWAVKQLAMDHIAVPDNGYYGVPREFMGARVYDDRSPKSNPTVTAVGGCDSKGVDLLHCTQKFRLDYVLSVDRFYCTTPNVAGNVGSKCDPKDIRWIAFSSEAQSEEFSREYNRITDGWDKFISQTLGDMPKIFMQCVSGDTSGQPPVVAAPPIARATADQCADTGMQLGAMVTMGKIGTSAKVTSDPLVELKFTAEQINKAKAGLKDLSDGIASNAYNKALATIIEGAVKADNTGGLSFAFKQVADMPSITAKMTPEAKKLMEGYKPTGNLTIEEWFHRFWNTKDNWFSYPYFDGFEGAATAYFPKVGELMDRFGSPGRFDKAAGKVEGGGFLAPKDGTPYSQRALPPSNVSADVSASGPGYHVYKWVKPWGPAEVAKYGDIKAGKIAPWFDQPGGGTQYLLPGKANVERLKQDGYLVEVPQQ